jgi:hypothetical protein
VPPVPAVLGETQINVSNKNKDAVLSSLTPVLRADSTTVRFGPALALCGLPATNDSSLLPSRKHVLKVFFRIVCHASSRAEPAASLHRVLLPALCKSFAPDSTASNRVH